MPTIATQADLKDSTAALGHRTECHKRRPLAVYQVCPRHNKVILHIPAAATLTEEGLLSMSTVQTAFAW